MANLIIGTLCLIAAIHEHWKEKKLTLFWSGWNYFFGVSNIILGLT